MKFAFALLPIAAVLRFVVAGPVFAGDLTKRAPVRVTNLVCDGDSYKCTATLNYGDGLWVAQWSTAVFHIDPFGQLTEKPITSMAPVRVKRLTCDGDTYKCTGALDYGDGNWVAQWDVEVFQQTLFGQEKVVNAMAPVYIDKLFCDGDTGTCFAKLIYGAGNWVAEWGTNIFHGAENLF